MSDQPPTYPGQPSPPPASEQGPSYGQPGQSYGQPPVQGGYGQAPHGWTPPPSPPRDHGKRPGTVLAASIITIVTSLLSLIGTGLALVALLVARDDMMAEIQSEPGLDGTGLDAGSLYDVIVVALIVVVVWCLISTLLGFWALRRSNAARILLTISAAMAALLSLIAIMSIVSAVSLLAAIAVLVLLYVGGANEWYARR